MKKVTIQDIAKELGLSRNTVSKALANSDTVAAETKYMILKKAYECGYTKIKASIPDEIIEDSQKNEIQTVMVLVRKEVNGFWNRIIMGISEELNEKHCRLQLNFVSNEDEKNGVLPMELTENISGLIVLSVFDLKYVKKLMSAGLPTVFLDAPVHTDDFAEYGDVLIFEGENSVRHLMKQMISQNLRRFAFIGDIHYCRSIYDRYRGFTEALEEAGIPLDEQILYTDSRSNHYYSKDEIEGPILSMPFIPDAIVCANDDTAKEVYGILKSKGINIPKDVAVTGFDNKEEFDLLSPGLTSVMIGNQRMGKTLVLQLLRRMEKPELPHEITCVVTRPVFRESSQKIRKI